MKYRRVSNLTENMNNNVNKTKRKNAAASYICMLHEGKTVINIDESIISSTDERKYSWQ